MVIVIVFVIVTTTIAIIIIIIIIIIIMIDILLATSHMPPPLRPLEDPRPKARGAHPLLREYVSTAHELRLSTEIYGGKRVSMNTHRKLVLFLQKSPKVSRNLREFTG